MNLFIKENTKQFNAGDLKQDKIDEEKERMEKLRAAVNEFDQLPAADAQKQPVRF